MSRQETLLAVFAAVTALCASQPAEASCPFCPPAQPTISEQLDNSELAVLAKWEKIEKPTGELEGAEPQTTFRILEVFRPPKIAEPELKPGAAITVNFQRDGKPGEWMLLLRGTDANGLKQWNISSVDEVSYGYVKNAPRLERPTNERLSYFLNYLEHDDPFIANDAFAEFTQAKYQDVAQLAPKFSREKLRAWLEDMSDARLMRHGFYGMLLGLCGNQDDAEYLARRIMSPPVPDKPRLGIDGMMAGYVLLTGEPGFQRIIDVKLRVTERIESEVTFVMTTLRFLWEYAPDRVPQEKVAAAMRLLLDDVKYAEIVIIDLARWKDWEIAPRLIDNYGRPPFELPSGKQRVVQFALTAQKHLTKKEQLSPQAKKRLSSINTFLDRLRRDEPNLVESAERSLNPEPRPVKTDGPRNQLEGNLDVQPAGAANRNP